MNKTKLLAMAAVAVLLASAPAIAQDGGNKKEPPPCPYANQSGDQPCPCAHMGKGPGGKGMMAQRMFDKLDTDKDGVITEGEFIAQTKERFASMDADGDGKVTKEEAKAHHEKMREERQKKMEEFKGKGPGGPGNEAPPAPPAE